MTVSRAGYNALGQLAWTEDGGSNRTTYAYCAETGNRISTTDPLNQVSHTDYTPDGKVWRQWGAGQYPAEPSPHAVTDAHDTCGRFAAVTSAVHGFTNAGSTAMFRAVTCARASTIRPIRPIGPTSPAAT